MNEHDRQEANEIAAGLSGMVPVNDNGRLQFRDAREDERPLNNERRRLIGRAIATGTSEQELLNKLTGWEVLAGW